MRYRSGQYEKSAELYEQAVAGHRAAGREVAAARSAAHSRAVPERSRADCGRDISIAACRRGVGRESGSGRRRREAHAILAEWYAFAMTDEEVAEHANKAHELASAADSPNVLCWALNAKGWLLQRQHHAPEAAAMFEALVEVAQSNDIPRRGADGTRKLWPTSDRNQTCQELSPNTWRRSRSRNDLATSETERLLSSNLALYYFYTGQWDRTESYAGRAVESITISELQNFGHFPLLMLTVTRGDIDAARTHLRELKSWSDDEDAQSRDSYLIAEAGGRIGCRTTG